MAPGLRSAADEVATEVPAGDGSAVRPDLRLPALGAVAWTVALAVPLLSEDGWPRALATVALTLLGGGLVFALRRAPRAWPLAVVVVAVGVGAVTQISLTSVRDNPVAAWAQQRAQVRVSVEVTGDPRATRGGFGDQYVLSARIVDITGRGQRFRLRTPVVLLGDRRWLEVRLGSTVATSGRLAPTEDTDVAALLVVGEPEVTERPDLWWRGAAALRGEIREAVAHRPGDQAALVPALVDGDDSALSADLQRDFRTTGLTHLLAVSGTNLTLVIGFLLVVARWCGVRGRWLHIVGAVGILGFVLLARTEPSVVRAAAMGAVGLLGLGHNGLQRGLRGLGAAVLALLLVEPSLARSVGFALSVAATAGILLIAPSWRDALDRWLPRWLAEAIAVPAAAQLAVTPIIAAISGEVSLVAVLANLLADPAVAPATVLGLLGGVCGLVFEPAGRVLGSVASWCVGWIITVAERGAGLPMPALTWGDGVPAVVVLTVVCLVVAVTAPRVIRHRLAGIGTAIALVSLIAIRPPAGAVAGDWVMAVCDVGQGDALVLASGPGRAVVVDAGAEPETVANCLDRLGVEAVDLFVLTHLHADHVGGAAGVTGRPVAAVWTGPVTEPDGGAATLRDALAGTGLEPQVPALGGRHRIGAVELEVIGPRPSAVPGEDAAVAGTESAAVNDASLVLLADVAGVRLLLTGDVEPSAQRALARARPDLEVDVLKLPHHGSASQEMDWLTSLSAEDVVVSVGAENEYGHPSPRVLEELSLAGAEIHRTDTEGTLLVRPSEDGAVVEPAR